MTETIMTLETAMLQRSQMLAAQIRIDFPAGSSITDNPKSKEAFAGLCSRLEECGFWLALFQRVEGHNALTRQAESILRACKAELKKIKEGLPQDGISPKLIEASGSPAKQMATFLPARVSMNCVLR